MAPSRASTSSSVRAFGIPCGTRGAPTSSAGSARVSPSSRQKRWKDRTATTARAIDDGANVARPSSSRASRRYATYARTVSSPTAPGSWTPRRRRNCAYRRRSRRYAASVFAARPRSTASHVSCSASNRWSSSRPATAGARATGLRDRGDVVDRQSRHAALGPGLGGRDERGEERVRPVGTALELGVRLRGHEERVHVLGQLDELDEPVVGRRSRGHQPALLEPPAVAVVHLVAVAVTLVDHLGAVRALHDRARLELRGYAPRRIVPPMSTISRCSSIRSMTGCGVCG